MNRDHELLLHFLAAIAYRTQKALRGAPARYPDLAVGHGSRTPVEILRHMTSLMGYTQTLFLGGEYPMVPDALPTFDDEVARFHDVLNGVGELLRSGAPLRDISAEQLLQGPSGRHDDPCGAVGLDAAPLPTAPFAARISFLPMCAETGWGWIRPRRLDRTRNDLTQAGPTSAG